MARVDCPTCGQQVGEDVSDSAAEMANIPKHDWVPTGHETLACQYPGCGLSPLGPDIEAFYAVHAGPATERQRRSRYFGPPTLAEAEADAARLDRIEAALLHLASLVERLLTMHGDKAGQAYSSSGRHGYTYGFARDNELPYEEPPEAEEAP